MSVARTMALYLGRTYLFHAAWLFGVFLGIVFLFDTIELLRRASKHDDVPLSTVLEMGLLKLPEAAEVIAPFMVLFGAMLTFWQLNRRQELVVMRAAGFSFWQFLAPLVGAAALIGIVEMAVLNPVSAIFTTRYHTLESVTLAESKRPVTMFRDGLWLRQEQADGYAIFHASRVDLPEWRLHDVMALFFAADDAFSKRLDAPEAALSKGEWVFDQARVYQSAQAVQTVPRFSMPTELTGSVLEESFSSPDTMSFWELPGYIQSMTATGFDPARLIVHFHSLLARPLLFVAMILLAAAVSLRPPREHGVLKLVVAGIGFGFVVFFLSEYLQALGTSHQIPAALAAWSPALVSSLLGLSALLTLEDG